MTSAAWTLLALAAVAAVVDWYAVARGAAGLEYVAKPATLLLLIGVAITLDPTHADQRAWFAVALVCSLAGDVFLMLPSDWFVAGLASFFLAHVAYVGGFSRHGGSAGSVALATVPVVVVAAFLAVKYVRALRARDEARLVGPVLAYVAVIAAMVASALAWGDTVAALGALLFMASDAMIGWNRFVRAFSWAPVAIIVTYHLGQTGLVLSLVR
ncbi:MAG: lysoplasmalogenase [Acidimicrobiia bacterium]